MNNNTPTKMERPELLERVRVREFESKSRRIDVSKPEYLWNFAVEAVIEHWNGEIGDAEYKKRTDRFSSMVNAIKQLSVQPNIPTQETEEDQIGLFEFLRSEPTEEFVHLPQYEDNLIASSIGKVYTVKELTQYAPTGTPTVYVKELGKPQSTRSVGKIILNAFSENYIEGKHVQHRDGNLKNNRIENLYQKRPNKTPRTKKKTIDRDSEPKASLYNFFDLNPKKKTVNQKPKSPKRTSHAKPVIAEGVKFNSIGECAKVYDTAHTTIKRRIQSEHWDFHYAL